MKHSTPVLPWATNQIIDTQQLLSLAPSFNRYIEPFFGGGSFYHTLCPDTPALVNDKNQNIIDFYRLLLHTNSALKSEIFKILEHWKLIDDFFELIKDDLSFVESDVKTKLISAEDMPFILRTIFSLNLTQEKYEVLFDSKNTTNADLLIENLIAACTSYLKSAAKSLQKFEFSAKILQNGYYYYLRDLYNSWQKKSAPAKEKKLAVWYFLNLLGYSARVTYSISENHHLPISSSAPSYREISSEIDRIFSPAYLSCFKNCSFYAEDFATFLSSLTLNEDDFIFIDPPFNVKWQHYEETLLTIEQKKQLAEILSTTKAKWMIVMKANDFHPEFFKDTELHITEPEIAINTGERFIVAKNY